jgi:hypothetical protein
MKKKLIIFVIVMILYSSISNVVFAVSIIFQQGFQ